LKGKAGYNEGREEKKKKKKKEKNKKMGWSMASFFIFSSWAPLVVQGMEMCVIPGSCSSLGQRAFPVNPGDAPYPVTGVGGVK
jgi:hypothetical protein